MMRVFSKLVQNIHFTALIFQLPETQHNTCSCQLSFILHRFSRANLMCAKNTLLSFRLSVILHQRHPSDNHKDMQPNASVQAAFVHALGDLFQSISVLTSALIIYFKVRMFAFTHCHPKFID